ncbi:MAG: hypothetical protein NW200_00985, partial [Hyphomonadaceae bacterium]|nr:hypothetical protein [Hyphomonadaceae bacterium]
FTAYGPEQTIVHPPRPADPRTPWNQEWLVKIRHRSATMQMLGASMGGMGAPQAVAGQPACPPPSAGQAAGSSVGSALGAATGIPGAGAVGGAMGRMFGKGKQKEPAPANPDCPR